MNLDWEHFIANIVFNRKKEKSEGLEQGFTLLCVGMFAVHCTTVSYKPPALIGLDWLVFSVGSLHRKLIIDHH